MGDEKAKTGGTQATTTTTTTAAPEFDPSQGPFTSDAEGHVTAEGDEAEEDEAE